MENFTMDEFIAVEEIYQDVSASINLLDAWAEKKNDLEETIIVEKIKAKLDEFKKIISNH